MIKISPSILSSDFTRLGEEIRAVEEAGADLIHIDVMDGHFVPNITIGPLIVKAVKDITSLPLDVHLMISDPDRYIDDFVKAGADIITVHAETVYHLHRTIQVIKKMGVQTGVALNPATPVEMLNYILTDIDIVMIMSVNPGFGGQQFIPEAISKIETVRKMIEKKGLATEIEVDGGINEKTISSVYQAGANIFVAGSAIFLEDDYKKVIDTMRKACL
ncbi:MAG: ribulose-phosphate 3-epimerase [Deltaproteobacteria bacterium]|nr:ribulose-phosphate 3-epimerase [Deltaproteobacteria bacterium]